MAAAVDPMLKAIYLCDDFLSAGAGKVHLFGVFNSFRATAPNPPFTLGRLCVVAQFVGGLGPIPVSLEITDGLSGEALYSSGSRELQFPTRHTVVYACFRIRNCRFPRIGAYFIELYCRSEFLEDRRFTVVPSQEG